MSAQRVVRFYLDGREIAAVVEPRMLLVDYLTFEEKSTGVHDGCCEGVCGSCTVWVDDEPTRSCLTFVVQLEGRRVTTPAGVLGDERFDGVHAALASEHAIQCGYCTPGLLMSVLPDLEGGLRGPDPLERLVSGTVCRCGGYASIIRALRRWQEDGEDASDGSGARRGAEA